MTHPTTIKVMGIINVTPDSFSDGGQFSTTEDAVAQAEALVKAGADILDIGGESTRPFADPVSAEEETARVVPAIKAIRKRFTTPISIDTTKASVARAALLAGADILNDISALRHDPLMIEVARSTSVPIIIMHMQGTPGNMQNNPVYDDVVAELLDFFRERLKWIQEQGITKERLIIDPGIGFGKKLEHNLSILKHLHAFATLGCPVLLGHSRKRFIGEITDTEVQERDLATAVVAALAVDHNIDIVRVHNVAATRQAIQMAEAIHQAQ